MSRRAPCFWFAVTVLLTCGLGSSEAQDDTVDFRSFFTLSTPGARANAMGRTFVGIADDASAAMTNPAGLQLLTRPQVYGEFKSSHIEDFGVVDVTPANFTGLHSRPSFLAASVPINSRVTIAANRHEFFGVDWRFVGSEQFQFRILGTSYSGSVAASVRPDLTIGGTVSYARLSLSQVEGATLGVDKDPISDDVGVTVGGLWRPSDELSVGLAVAIWRNGVSSADMVQPNRVTAGASVVALPGLKVGLDLAYLRFPLDGQDLGEVHAGAEYQVPMSGTNRVFLRGGAYTTAAVSRAGDINDPSTVGTFGAGLAVGQRLQFDLAVLTRKELVVSAAVRF